MNGSIYSDCHEDQRPLAKFESQRVINLRNRLSVDITYWSRVILQSSHLKSVTKQKLFKQSSFENDDEQTAKYLAWQVSQYIALEIALYIFPSYKFKSSDIFVMILTGLVYEDFLIYRSGYRDHHLGDYENSEGGYDNLGKIPRVKPTESSSLEYKKDFYILEQLSLIILTMFKRHNHKFLHPLFKQICSMIEDAKNEGFYETMNKGKTGYVFNYTFEFPRKKFFFKPEHIRKRLRLNSFDDYPTLVNLKEKIINEYNNIIDFQTLINAFKMMGYHSLEYVFDFAFFKVNASGTKRRLQTLTNIFLRRNISTINCTYLDEKSQSECLEWILSIKSYQLAVNHILLFNAKSTSLGVKGGNDS